MIQTFKTTYIISWKRLNTLKDAQSYRQVQKTWADFHVVLARVLTQSSLDGSKNKRVCCRTDWEKWSTNVFIYCLNTKQHVVIH